MRIKLCGFVVWAVFLACGLMSCQQEDRPHGVQYPIVFSNSSETRATATEDDLKDGFTVYAFVQGNAGSTSFAKDVVYNATYDVWAFASPEYWIPNTTYSFKAFYPATLTAGTLEVDNSSNALNFTISNFDVVNHQVDVMVASATAKVESGPVPTSGDVNGNRVNLNFKHLLACIDIQMTSAITGVIITNITLEDADTNGSYDSATGEWSAEDSGDITITPKDGALNSTTPTSVTNDGFLVIPGDASGKTLVIETNINKTYRVTLPDKTWAKGNKYTYTAEVKQSNIIFNEPKVDEWDSENATGSVIIK